MAFLEGPHSCHQRTGNWSGGTGAYRQRNIWVAARGDGWQHRRCIPSRFLARIELSYCGEVPERSNGAVSKTVVPLTGDRGFESLPLRQRVLRVELPKVQACARGIVMDNPRDTSLGDRRASDRDSRLRRNLLSAFCAEANRGDDDPRHLSNDHRTRDARVAASSGGRVRHRSRQSLSCSRSLTPSSSASDTLGWR
jgi:hypothetical protein